MTPHPRNTVVTLIKLWEISGEVGDCWSEVGLLLCIPASEIYAIDETRWRNIHKAMAILSRWKKQEGCNATVGRLADVLEKVGRKDIAEMLPGGE